MPSPLGWCGLVDVLEITVEILAGNYGLVDVLEIHGGLVDVLEIHGLVDVLEIHSGNSWKFTGNSRVL